MDNPERTEHTHEYDCIVCGAHFDNSRDLSRHNEEAHLKHAKGMEVPRTSTSENGTRDGNKLNAEE